MLLAIVPLTISHRKSVLRHKKNWKQLHCLMLKLRSFAKKKMNHPTFLRITRSNKWTTSGLMETTRLILSIITAFIERYKWENFSFLEFKLGLLESNKGELAAQQMHREERIRHTFYQTSWIVILRHNCMFFLSRRKFFLLDAGVFPSRNLGGLPVETLSTEC